jgi:glycosyltransferase involved in cell wall biosynthesis
LSTPYAAVGCVYNEDPIFAPQAWQRRWEGDAAYSLCSITHTTCTQAVMDAFSQLVTAPLYAWDAMICTSQSVKTTVDQVLDYWTNYLAERLGATRRPAVELPVIPLGVDCDAFDVERMNPQIRKNWRTQLGIADEDVAFLFFGRLSYHGKANPLPMYRSLETAANYTKRKLHLILAGWFANESLEAHFREAAAVFCPSVKLSVVDGRKLDVRRQIWSAADIFTSLSDNIQETFGLTPVEAMAAGLPAVISDWDGYRDTVRHGQDGFRIPTTIAPAGHGDLYFRRHFLGVDNYDRYIGHMSHFTAVDIPQTTLAYINLIQNAELRAQFGASARQRARDTFHWRVIIQRYQALWSELARRRQAAQSQVKPAKVPHPLRPDPLTLFASYATAPLNDQTLLGIAPDSVVEHVKAYYDAPMLQYMAHPSLLGSVEEMTAIYQALLNTPKTVGDVLQAFPAKSHESLRLSIVWMLKMGVLVRQFA